MRSLEKTGCLPARVPACPHACLPAYLHALLLPYVVLAIASLPYLPPHCRTYRIAAVLRWLTFRMRCLCVSFACCALPALDPAASGDHTTAAHNHSTAYHRVTLRSVYRHLHPADHLWLHWRRPAIHLARRFVDFEPGIHFCQV